MWSFLVVDLVFLFPTFSSRHPFHNPDPEAHNNMEIDGVDHDQQDQSENESESDEEYEIEDDDGDYGNDEDFDDDDDDNNEDDDNDEGDEDEDDHNDNDDEGDEEEDDDYYDYDDDEGGISTDFEDGINLSIKWKLRLNRVVTHVESEYQGLSLVSTKQYGKSLTIDGHLQCCEKDEYVFHENLVHPALLAHNNGPKTVFIMGGGSGAAAREVLKHKDIERVIICEIDQEVVKICRKYMTANHEAFNDERLQIVYKDAKEQLEESEEKFDVIIGDVNLPETTISKELYIISFYENVVKTKLKDNGIFVIQAGSAGTFTHLDIFWPIHFTLKRVFTYVIPYKAQVPSFGDVCGWIMASNAPISLNAEELDNRISQRIRGELYYLDGPVIVASTVLDKIMKESRMEDFHVITENSPTLVRGAVLFLNF